MNATPPRKPDAKPAKTMQKAIKSRLPIEWQTVKVKHQPRKSTPLQQPWEWNFWRSHLAGFTFQVGCLPYSLMDLSPKTRYQPPDQQQDSCWQLWFTPNAIDPPEYMAVLHAREPHEALEQAHDVIADFLNQHRQELARRLEETRRSPPSEEPYSFHDPRKIKIWRLEEKIKRIDHDTRQGQASLF